MYTERVASDYYDKPGRWQESPCVHGASERLRACVGASLVEEEVESVLDAERGNGCFTRRLPGDRVVGLDSSEEAPSHSDGEYWMLGPPFARTTALCHPCGSSANVTYKALGGRKLRRRVIEGLTCRRPKIGLPVWLVVLLKRAQEAR